MGPGRRAIKLKHFLLPSKRFLVLFVIFQQLDSVILDLFLLGLREESAFALKAFGMAVLFQLNLASVRVEPEGRELNIVVLLFLRFHNLLELRRVASSRERLQDLLKVESGRLIYLPRCRLSRFYHSCSRGLVVVRFYYFIKLFIKFHIFLP